MSNAGSWKQHPGRYGPIALALITGARVGELLALRWEHVTDDALVFLEQQRKAAADSTLAGHRRCSSGIAAPARARVHQRGDDGPLHDERRVTYLTEPWSGRASEPAM